MAEEICPGCGKPAINRLLERVPTTMLDYSGRIWHKVCAEQALARFKEIEAQVVVLRKALEHACDYFATWSDESYYTQVTARICREALSSDAGKDLLERMRKLEDLAKAVDEWNQVREELNSHTQAVKDGTLPEEIQRQDVNRMMAAITRMVAVLQDLKTLEEREKDNG